MHHNLLALGSMAICVGLVSMSTPAPAAPATTVVRPNARTAAQAEMTPEQLRAVRPMPWYQPDKLPPATPEAAREPQAGSSGASPPGAPNPRADESAKREFPLGWRKQAFEPQPSPGNAMERAIDFGSANTYTPYDANNGADRTLFPLRAIGLLTNNAGSCSASVISGRNIVVTAAHCCYTRGVGWQSNFRFYPAYRSGQHPTYGSFPWTSARILTSWITRGARQDDVCLISLGNNTAGRAVTYYTGWLGRQWDWPSIRSLHALGYPGNIGGGQTMQLCAAESYSPSTACGGNTVLNMGCNMTYGASGGPWVNGYRGGNWVNSVVSGYDNTSCTGTFGQTFNGPRFTSANIATLCTAQGC